MLDVYKTTLVEKKQLTVNIFLFHFQLINPKEINFKAGQYLMLKINNQSRLYSISSPNFIKDNFELVVEIVPGGLASTFLNNLKEGDEVDFQGPAGMFTLKENNRSKIFLATGTGIAPIRAIIKSKILNPKQFGASNLEFRIFLFWGLRSRHDVYFFEEFKKIAEENSHFQFKICLSREKNLGGLDKNHFMLGHINDGLKQLIFQPQFLISKFDFYICGNSEMVKSMREFLNKQRVVKENIIFERF